MESKKDIIKKLILDGKENKEIVKLCNISLRTVQRYRKEFKTDDIKNVKKNDKRQNDEIDISKAEEKDFEYVDDDGLTDKQRLFCNYYIQSFNAYQSAIKAGYSENYARSRVYDMLANVRIKTYLNQLKEQQKLELFLTQEKILNRHLQIALSDMNDFINPDGTLKKNIDGTLIKKITVRTSSTNGGSENSSVSLELEDRKESLKFLTKYLGLDPEVEMQKEKVEIAKSLKSKRNTLPPAYFDEMDEEIDAEE